MAARAAPQAVLLVEVALALGLDDLFVGIEHELRLVAAVAVFDCAGECPTIGALVQRVNLHRTSALHQRQGRSFFSAGVLQR